MFKKASLSILVVLISCFNFVVLANPISPRLLYTSSANSDLTITANTANCKSVVTGYMGQTTKIEVEQILEKETSTNNWVEVKTWTTTVYSYKISFTNEKSKLSSGKYRVTTIAKVYVGDNFEQTTTHSTETVV